MTYFQSMFGIFCIFAIYSSLIEELVATVMSLVGAVISWGFYSILEELKKE